MFLDEPTVGVDPLSRDSILEGIMKLRDMGATIVYTTHYMEEVEMICDRVIIIDKGHVLASGTTDELKRLAKIDEKIIVEANSFDSKYIEEIKSFKAVHSADYKERVLTVSYKEGADNLVKIIEYLKKNHINYSRVYSERPTLNDVFLELTGKELRD